VPIGGTPIDPRPAARIILVPKDANVKPLTFTLRLETDEVIDQWLASLPDFDEQEQAVTIEAVLNDPAFGESRKSRIERLKFARYAATIANFVAIAFCSVGVPFFLHANVPQHAVITIIAAMPFLSVMAIIMSKGLYSVRRLQTIFR
jgi:hypothetical protein